MISFLLWTGESLIWNGKYWLEEIQSIKCDNDLSVVNAFACLMKAGCFPLSVIIRGDLVINTFKTKRVIYKNISSSILSVILQCF
jgi:hypothetical protein